MDRTAGSGERNGGAIFDECIPMSVPQRFTGTWATDFEFNQFHEGQVLTAEEAWQRQDATDRLWGDALERNASDNSAYVMEVEFVGRYPLCNLTEPGRDILVDDLIHARTIERTSSQMKRPLSGREQSVRSWRIASSVKAASDGWKADLNALKALCLKKVEMNPD